MNFSAKLQCVHVYWWRLLFNSTAVDFYYSTCKYLCNRNFIISCSCRLNPSAQWATKTQIHKTLGGKPQRVKWSHTIRSHSWDTYSDVWRKPLWQGEELSHPSPQQPIFASMDSSILSVWQGHSTKALTTSQQTINWEQRRGLFCLYNDHHWLPDWGETVLKMNRATFMN